MKVIEWTPRHRSATSLRPIHPRKKNVDLSAVALFVFCFFQYGARRPRLPTTEFKPIYFSLYTQDNEPPISPRFDLSYSNVRRTRISHDYYFFLSSQLLFRTVWVVVMYACMPPLPPHLSPRTSLTRMTQYKNTRNTLSRQIRIFAESNRMNNTQ